MLVALLFPAALLNYLDRQMLASMKYSVMSDLPSIGTDAHWGFMLGQFKWVYAFLSPIGGYVADRFSRRWTISGSILVWSAAAFWTGRVTSYGQLVGARSLMGVSEAFYIPAALALITDYHPGPTRSRAVGLHQMGIYCGVILGGFGGYAAEAPRLGWRMAFEACGLLGMAYAIPLLTLLKDWRPAVSADAPALQVGSKSGRNARLTRSASELLTNPSFVLLVLYFTLPALAGWLVRDWMPAILKQRFAIGQGKAGISATLFWQIAAIFGALAGGWLADRWMRRAIRGRIYVSAVGVTLLVPAILGAGNAGTLATAVAFLALFGLGWGFFDCNNMPILCQIVAPRLRATGYGVMNLVSISCGGLADWGIGLANDRGVPWRATVSVLGGAIVMAAGLVLLIRPRPELVAREPQS